MSRFLFNDASLHGQFSSPEYFFEALDVIFRMRDAMQRAGFQLEVNRRITERAAIKALTFREVINKISNPQNKRQVLTWLDRDGPFWDEPPIHSGSEYFECDGEVVTDTAFAETQWKLFEKERPRRVKPLLYVYRVLLTGIHLMRTGLVEANLVTLNETFRLPFIPELIARKLAGPEQSALEDGDIGFYEAEYQRLRGELQKAHDDSHLPELPDEQTRAALNDLLVRIRLGGK